MIQMIDMNYHKAGIDIREKFSFTQKEIEDTLLKIREQDRIRGCVIVSTCNRTSIWVSVKNSIDLVEMLCDIKHVELAAYRGYFDAYEREDAIRYLFWLAGGLKSQILGDQQIVTQINDAANRSREVGCMDQNLEVLFRMAVTSGKEIKTLMELSQKNPSAPKAAIDQLKKQGVEFENRNCLVIGNGIIGKLTAQLLMEQGAKVTVTVRQYRSGVIEIPCGAARIDYGKRYELIPECDMVFSATASPNMTIKKEEIEKIRQGADELQKKLQNTSPQIYVDLAVPRDIDPGIDQLEKIMRYDIDSFHLSDVTEDMKIQIQHAEEMLEKALLEFLEWYEMKDVVPTLMRLSDSAAEDVVLRLQKPLRKAQPDQPEELTNKIRDAAAKVVRKMLFEIRDEVDVPTFRKCVMILQGMYENERRDKGDNRE